MSLNRHNLRSAGFTTQQLTEPQASGEKRSKADYLKFWYTAPANIEVVTDLPVGVYTMDVLQFKFKYDYVATLKQDTLDADKKPIRNSGEKMFIKPGDLWWEKHVTIHTDKMSLPCRKNFGFSKIIGTDAVCGYLKLNPSISKNSINKTYAIFLIRMHPNSPLGNKEMKFYIYIDTKGKLCTKLYEEYLAMKSTGDVGSLRFFTYDEDGKTLKCRFTAKEKAINGKTSKWVECDKVDILARSIPLSNTDLDFIGSLDIEGGIKVPTDAEYDAFLTKAKAPVGIAQTTVTTTTVAPSTQTVTPTPAKVEVVKAEPVSTVETMTVGGVEIKVETSKPTGDMSKLDEPAEVPPTNDTGADDDDW